MFLFYNKSGNECVLKDGNQNTVCTFSGVTLSRDEKNGVYEIVRNGDLTILCRVPEQCTAVVRSDDRLYGSVAFSSEASEQSSSADEALERLLARLANRTEAAVAQEKAERVAESGQVAEADE